MDGDLSTAWQAEEHFFLSYGDHIGRILCDEDGYSRRERVSIDLGAELLLERIRIVSGLEDPRRIARDFKVSISPVRAVYLDPFSDEGVTRRIPFWALPRDLHVTDNVQHVREIVVPAQHRRAIAFTISLGEHDTPWDVVEIEAYARGVADSASYVSRILDMGGRAVWGEIRWSGRESDGSEVLLQTRSGRDSTPFRYWRFTGRGTERQQVDEDGYSRLHVGERAGLTYDVENWDPWASRYEFADSLGTEIVPTAPHQFFQVKVDLVSSGEVGPQLDYLEILASNPPAATSLTGEVSPSMAEAGKRTTFTYVVRPEFSKSDRGFDTMELTATSALIRNIDDVRSDWTVLQWIFRLKRAGMGCSA